jgi:hypothetical protein
MDNERDIEIAAIKLMTDTKLPKDEVLRMILGRYESQGRLEEAVIVRRIIERAIQTGRVRSWTIPRFLS